MLGLLLPRPHLLRAAASLAAAHVRAQAPAASVATAASLLHRGFASGGGSAAKVLQQAKKGIFLGHSS